MSIVGSGWLSISSSRPVDVFKPFPFNSYQGPRLESLVGFDVWAFEWFSSPTARGDLMVRTLRGHFTNSWELENFQDHQPPYSASYCSWHILTRHNIIWEKLNLESSVEKVEKGCGGSWPALTSAPTPSSATLCLSFIPRLPQDAQLTSCVTAHNLWWIKICWARKYWESAFLVRWGGHIWLV